MLHKVREFEVAKTDDYGLSIAVGGLNPMRDKKIKQERRHVLGGRRGRQLSWPRLGEKAA